MSVSSSACVAARVIGTGDSVRAGADRQAAVPTRQPLHVMQASTMRFVVLIRASRCTKEASKVLNWSNGPDCASTYNFFARGVMLGAERESRADVTVAQLEAARRASVRADIAKRVKRACTHLSDEEFSRLIDEMTDRQLKGERRINREFLVE
jgi:hypothetical protein